MLTYSIFKRSSSVGPQYFKGLCPGTGLPVPGSPRGDWPQNLLIVADEAVVDKAARRRVKYFIAAVERFTEKEEDESES